MDWGEDSKLKRMLFQDCHKGHSLGELKTPIVAVINYEHATSNLTTQIMT